MEQTSLHGTVCAECQTFLATPKDNDEERRKIAELWPKQYKELIKSEYVSCDGCFSKSGRILSLH